MIRQGILAMSIVIFLAGCAATPEPAQLTPEEEALFALDKVACGKKADQSARGFGKGSITWERKRLEIYDYCMKNKGWD